MIANEDEFLKEITYYSGEFKDIVESYGGKISIDEFNDSMEIVIKWGD